MSTFDLHKALLNIFGLNKTRLTVFLINAGLYMFDWDKSGLSFFKKYLESFMNNRNLIIAESQAR